MKCLLTYQLSLSLFSGKITFENTNFIKISSETKTEILCLSLRMSLRIFVNLGPGDFLQGEIIFQIIHTYILSISLLIPPLETQFI